MEFFFQRKHFFRRNKRLKGTQPNGWTNLVWQVQSECALLVQTLKIIKKIWNCKSCFTFILFSLLVVLPVQFQLIMNCIAHISTNHQTLWRLERVRRNPFMTEKFRFHDEKPAFLMCSDKYTQMAFYEHDSWYDLQMSMLSICWSLSDSWAHVRCTQVFFLSQRAYVKGF